MAALTVPLFPQDFDNPLFTLCWPLARDGFVGPHLGGAEPGSFFGLISFGVALVLAIGLLISAGPARSIAGKMGASIASLLLAAVVITWQSQMPEPPAEKLARGVALAEVLARLGYFDAAFSETMQLSDEPSPAITGQSQNGSVP
jgi:hypothetical protein